MSSNQTDHSAKIAIIGMAGRFSRARTPGELWNHVRNGVECLTTLNDDELLKAGVPASLLANPNYVKVAGILDDMEGFDAPFFGFSPRDASIMDPQHRHFLECSWEALESAGIDPEKFDGAIGVFGGSGHNAYLPYNLLTNPKFVESVGFFLVRHTGNDKDFLSTRVSYCLKLTGPSMNIQTACSTSLVAIHVACQSLLNSECDLALAGGVTIEQPHRRGYLYEEGEILSPDGHCRAFDAQSKGTLFGSGVGIVALRRLSDALADGDNIHAVILSSAVNNDGANKVGYLAPSVEGQAACVREALSLADVPSETITYIECHGTGTPVGDPIEIAAMTQAFREDTEATQFCGVGSIKTNIGHLDTAAGVASLIKTVEALKHRELPPSINFNSPNPAIEFNRSPFYVNSQLKPWISDGAPRRAGVNSLGVGGTNAFVILEEAPAAPTTSPSRRHQLILLSSRSAAATSAGAKNLAVHLKENPNVSLADVAYTLQTARRRFEFRQMVVGSTNAAVADALLNADPSRVFGQKTLSKPSLAFTFPGGGGQHPNMGRELYETEPVYRKAVDECLRLLAPYVDYDLKPLLFPAPDKYEEAAAALWHGSKSLPSLFITEYALATLLMSWGLQPSALLGHSMGEYVAACLSGVFTVAEGLALVTKRGQLFETLPAGAMIGVPMSAAELRNRIGDSLDIGVENGPGMSVVSGPANAIDELESQFTQEGIDTRRIRIHVAAHSRMLDPILPAFEEMARTIRYRKPNIPFLSNVTGTWITPEQATDARYWVKHLRSTVRFSDNLQALLADPDRVVIEIAPGRTLTTLAKTHPAAGLGRPIFSTMRQANEEGSDVELLLTVAGRLWLTGLELDWPAFYKNEKRRKLELPTYPFEHRSYWIEPGKTQATAERSLTKKADIADWFYQPVWRRSLMPASPLGDTGNWLVFADNRGLADRIIHNLRAAGLQVGVVSAGDSFQARGSEAYTVNPTSAADYESLLSVLESSNRTPDRILHLWTLSVDASDAATRHRQHEDLGFFSLLYLSQAIGKTALPNRTHIAVVTQRMQQVAGELVENPGAATVLGPCKVMMHELPTVACVSIDLENRVAPWLEKLIAERIPQELISPTNETVIAYRGTERFVQAFEAVRLPEPAPESNHLRQGGVYMITGGLGGIALVLAEHLVRRVGARVILVSRNVPPPQKDWASWLAQNPADHKGRARINALKRLLDLGGEVECLAADVTDANAVKRVVQQGLDRFGAIHGVFHTAGVLDDGIIQLKTAETARAVLAPKTWGTLALDLALQDQPLDFMVLFSSVSSFSGLVGQVDYAAANAFLDAFAHMKTGRDGVFTVAVNWNAWQEVGMAAELARELGVTTTAPEKFLRRGNHPWLDRVLADDENEHVFATAFNTRTHWLLDEHRIKNGRALIPGTGYLELARAAVAESGQGRNGDIVLKDIFFLSPFVVEDNNDQELKVMLKRDSHQFVFQMAGPDSQIHVQGRAECTASSPETRIDINALMQRCQGKIIHFDSADDPHLAFGERWNNRKALRLGSGEAVLSLELKASFAEDLDVYSLHPALMDMATAGAQQLIPDFDQTSAFYVPMSYGQIRIRAGLPAALVSHIRSRPSTQTDVATFDVSLYDVDGRLLVEATEFTMRRVDDKSAMTRLAPASKSVKPARTANTILQVGLSQGISPHEGMQALERLLAGPMTAQVVVSSQDLHAVMESTKTSGSVEPSTAEADQGGASKQTRPNLATVFVAPETELQKSVAQVWEQLLGVEGVGIHDDFFDLGGHSLLLTQLVSRVRKQTKVDIPLRRFFEKRTIAGIVAEIEQELGNTGVARPVLKRVERNTYRVKTGQELR